MSSNAVKPGWHRLRAWWNRRCRPGDQVSTTASNAIERRAPANAEGVEGWEDEGGALARRASASEDSVRTPPDPIH